MTSHRNLMLAIGMFLCVAFPFQEALAASIGETSRLSPNPPGDLTYFGADTAIDGNYAGAISWGFSSAPSAFHLYNWRNGSLLSTVSVPETTNVDRFSAIDISGNRLLVGSQRNPIGSNLVAGAVLLYDISNPDSPQELLQLTAPVVSEAANFGAQIEFRGNRALIGAYGDTFPTSAPGAAFLYDLSDLNNVHVKTLKPTGGGSVHDLFGATLSMNDATAIVGGFAGSVYLFDLEIGSEQSVLQSPDSVYSHFGQSVDISDDQAIVWSRWNAAPGKAFSAAHLYDISDPSAPTYLTTLTGSIPLEETGYQGRVAIEGNWAVLSARSSNPDRMGPLSQEPNPGGAYAFNIADLSDVKEFRLRPKDFWIRSEFGISIDIDQANVVVGAWGDQVKGVRSGSAHVFSVPEPAALILVAPVAASVVVLLPRRRKCGGLNDARSLF
jgi:hypothetical protein